MKRVTVYNPQKGRIETIDVEYTEENTTYFKDTMAPNVYRITDWDGGLIIQTTSFGSYPLWVYDVSRADINYGRKEAKQLMRLHDYN
jgi:hypothetical protein